VRAGDVLNQWLGPSRRALNAQDANPPVDFLRGVPTLLQGHDGYAVPTPDQFHAEVLDHPFLPTEYRFVELSQHEDLHLVLRAISQVGLPC
jgi:hypothetical protein